MHGGKAMADHVMTPQSAEPLLQGTRVPQKAARLRALLAETRNTGQCLGLAGAFNGISAKVVEEAGFEIGYLTGAGLVNGATGYPDIGMLGGDEMARLAGYAARAVSIPVIADADTGFGEPVQVYRTVQMYEREGLCGLHIEDQEFPKRCGHLGGKSVIATEAMAAKIRAACDARDCKDFLIIARTDAAGVTGYDDALARARAYVDAGADVIFPEALHSEEELGRFAKDLRQSHPQAYLLANITEFGSTPLLPLSTLGALSYNLAIFPMTSFRVMLQALTDAMVVLRAEGGQTSLLPNMRDRASLYRLLHYEHYQALDARLAYTLTGSGLAPSAEREDTRESTTSQQPNL